MHIIRDAAGTPQRIILDDWPWDAHAHARVGDVLRLVMPMIAARYRGGVIMPNLDPPITTYAMLRAYWEEIKRALEEAVAEGASEDLLAFAPSMSFYLTDLFNPSELEKAAEFCGVLLLKYYPAGVTTNSAKGVKDASALWTPDTRPWQALRTLAEYGGTFMLHAANSHDKNGTELGPYAQEPDFLRETLPRIRAAHPTLRMTIEHLSTAEGCEAIRLFGGSLLGCSVTNHHLLLDQRDVFRSGMRPHLHCWPAIQPFEHTQELRKLVGEGRPYVFAGSDNAPHAQSRKECGCVLGGVFNAHASIELYAEALMKAGCPERLEDFACTFGPRFHGLKQGGSPRKMTLACESWQVPEFFEFSQDTSIPVRDRIVIPWRAGEEVRWKIVG